MTDPVPDPSATPQPVLLDEFERRVLGVLLEKSLAQPSYYPMTVNSIVAACNQKNNRDPVMDLDEDTVWKTLTELRERGLVTQIMPGPGQRIEKYKHETYERLGWEQRERAVMAELLLRGPQTVGELRSRCSRMMPFNNIEAVTIVLNLLASKSPPVVRDLPKEPGRSAVRHDHCVYAEGERAEPARSEPAGAADHTASHPGLPAPPAPSSSVPAVPGGAMEDLRMELENALADIGEMRETIAELEKRVATLEQAWN